MTKVRIEQTNLSVKVYYGSKLVQHVVLETKKKADDIYDRLVAFFDDPKELDGCGLFKRTELNILAGLVGEEAFELLVSGKGMLNIWRNSSPHNWWISDRNDNDTIYWHSGGGPFRYGFPDLKLFRKISDSKERVIQYWGSDSGQPMHSKYVLKKSVLKQHVRK